ncbi:hypothetical protein CDAR_58051 [Caerostris darwini]|uniref:Uncharacterized protein n=1 Tax=Caerostris darwini TaxID=1538125 RepID=A0AAV4U736_9ARAC|nr:hypothetical protein CDAR_58051 [Caerostris darwini]
MFRKSSSTPPIFKDLYPHPENVPGLVDFQHVPDPFHLHARRVAIIRLPRRRTHNTEDLSWSLGNEGGGLRLAVTIKAVLHSLKITNTDRLNHDLVGKGL